MSHEVTLKHEGTQREIIYLAPFSSGLYPDDDGTITIEIKELERLELRFDMNITEGWQVVGQRYGPLPWGAFLDKEKNIFYWQPGHGFLGSFRLIFAEIDNSESQTRKDVEVCIRPKF
jgi:hypothetical protein